MNKGSIAKCQNFKGQIEDSHFSGENGTILNPLSIPFLFWDRGTPLQKKEKQCWLVRPHRLKPRPEHKPNCLPSISILFQSSFIATMCH